MARAKIRMIETMKHETKVQWGLVAVFAAVLLIGAFIPATAQTPDPQNPNSGQTGQMQSNQAAQVPDLAQLNLTPEQIQRIRGINSELKDQRQAANQRLRLAQRALAEAMESPNQDEGLIDQRSREVAEAQAATFRLRTLSEFRILQVLTPEQRIRLREMRRQAMERRREQRIENNQRPRVFRRGDAFQRGRLGPKPGPTPNRQPPTPQQKPRP
jgi:Spy/CpxP family protein refolding chaperone